LLVFALAVVHADAKAKAKKGAKNTKGKKAKKGSLLEEKEEVMPLEQMQSIVATPAVEVADEVVAESVEEEEPAQLEETCSFGPEASIGVCSRPNTLKFIVNSCGDVRGPNVVNRAMEEGGVDISHYENATVFSEAWAYMKTLGPNQVFLMGDNVYNDGIGNWGKGFHPFGNNLAVIMADAGESFLKYHGYLTEDGQAGPLFYGYLEILKDKLKDGYLENEEFISLRHFTNNGIHVTWDDHDFLTNDPSNPHFLRHEFRKAEIEALTGWDRNYFRFGNKHRGIERTWTQELTDNKGNPFLIRFIFLDEETTHYSTQGCAYYQDPTSPTGFAPRQAKDKSLHCPDMDVIEDFDSDDIKRTFFGDDQLNWFREQLEKPADLIFVANGGPNFETDYDYASLTEFPGEKRKMIEVLRETGVEHVIFLTGDSHASYVTAVPHLVGYPLYTIVGSGLTKGLSYDRYVNVWGDISHRFLVAAGSTNNINKAASFAEVDIFFDEDNEAIVRFTPHIRESVDTNDGWKTWYKQTEPFDDEPWDAQYDIKISDLEIASDWPRYHYDSSIPHKFVTEVVYVKYGMKSNVTEGIDVDVSLSITNAKGETKSFPLMTGNNCGSGFYGFCKDKWGAFTYVTTKVGTYAPSLANQEICEHAGFVGDEIQWTISENGVEQESGTTTLKFRNTVIFNSDGPIEDLYHFGTQEAYKPVKGDMVGVPVVNIIDEPPVYGGFTVPVKGWNGSEFDNAAVQEAYIAYLAMDEAEKDTTALQSIYLTTYYPEIPKL